MHGFLTGNRQCSRENKYRECLPFESVKPFMYTFRMGKSGKIRIVIVAVCTVFVAVVFIAADYLFIFALDPLAKEDVFSSDEPEQDVVTDSTGQFDAETWLLTQAENVFITSYDGLQLHGYFIPAEIPSDRYVIAVHGYKSSAEAMADYAWHYYCQGWNVLVPEQRAHGLSEGRYIGMGCQERYDMLDWVDSILAENARARILFHGVSMGAATVMLVTGEPDLPENVCAAVEDCGYSSVTDQFTMQLKEQFGLPPFPLIPAASLVTKMRAGYFFGDGNCVRAVSRSVTPTLFIHGDADTFVPFTMLDAVYSAASCEKQKLVVSGAEHAESLDTDPVKYWAAVDSFVETYIPR